MATVECPQNAAGAKGLSHANDFPNRNHYCWRVWSHLQLLDKVTSESDLDCQVDLGVESDAPLYTKTLTLV